MSMSRHAPDALIGVYERLRAHPTTVARREAAGQVGSLLSSGELALPERETALAILGELVHDLEIEVRRALAMHVASCATLPSAVARIIAQDVETISLPFLRVSPALLDEDLIAIIQTGNLAKQIVIARRPTVSGAVTGALIGTHNVTVVATALQNGEAAISESAYHQIVDDCGGDGIVQNLLVERATLPLTVIERLIAAVSDLLRDRLIEKHGLPPDIAAELLNQARERALLQGAVSVPRVFDVEAFAARLRRKGQLTPTLLMRALCLGDRNFFDAGMAALAGISLESSVELVADRGPLGFRALYEKAGLPPEFFRAFRAALDVLANLRHGTHDGWRPANVHRILDRMVKEYDEACPADLEHLMSQMSRGVLGRADRKGRH